MAKTTRSSSSIKLGPQSTLEELLGGMETAQYSPKEQRKIDEINAKIRQIESGQGSSVNSGTVNPNAPFMGAYGGSSNDAGKLADLRQQLADIEAGAEKKRSGGFIQEGIEKLARMGEEGVDMTSYNAGKDASNEFANLLKGYTESGGLPNQGDVTQANDLASQLFSARKVALDQSIQDQTTAFQRDAARRGTMANDPVFAAKMRTGFLRQQDLLSAEQQAQGTQIAMSLPGQRLGYAGQRADVLNTVADRDNARYQQGIANLAALLGVGQSQLGMEQAWRLNTGTRETKNTSSDPFGTAMSGVGAIAGIAGSLMTGIPALSAGTSFSTALNKGTNMGGNMLNAGTQPNYSLGNYALRY